MLTRSQHLKLLSMFSYLYSRNPDIRIRQQHNKTKSTGLWTLTHGSLDEIFSFIIIKI